MPAYCFDFNVYKQAYVNMVIRSWQHYRRFKERYRFYTTTITYIHARIQEFFVGFGGGSGEGSKPDWLKKALTLFFLFFFCKS